MNKLYTIISGDIVNSSSLNTSSRLSLLEIMKDGSDSLQNFYGKEVFPLPVDIYSGDSWQLLLTKPENSLSVSLFYRLFIKSHINKKKIDSRISIAIGEIDLFPHQRVSFGDGEAFKLSGQALKKDSFSYMFFSFPMIEKKIEKLIGTMIYLTDALIKELTPSQSWAVLGAIMGKTQQQIADEWPKKPISQQSIAKHLKSAKWDYINECLISYDEFVRFITKQ